MEKVTKIEKKKFLDKASKEEREVEVLYQKIGNRWYAFSLIDDEVFFGSIPLDEVNSWTAGEPRLKKAS